MGRDVDNIQSIYRHHMFQSTRPYGARHREHVRTTSEDAVSIHTPLWGATDEIYQTRLTNAVSIHTPLWGATNGKVRFTSCGRFQSTRPYGARPSSVEGARMRNYSFNPHAPMGRDVGY